MDHKVVAYTSVLEDKRQTWGPSNTAKMSTQKDVLLSQFIVLPPYQGLGLGGTLLKIVYEYYLKNDKSCVQFNVEEPSDEFQSLMDLVELKFIWEAGYFKEIRNIFKGKKMSNAYINNANYDKVHLDKDEVNLISKKLKLPI